METAAAPVSDAEDAAPEAVDPEPRRYHPWMVARRERFRNRVPEIELVDHHGERHELYEDLLRDRTVVIHFMFTTCTGT